ncbi:MAG: asparagine synthase (glutamine-hydrolyzing) [Proteobacteria bacterium]|nr:asparagine synthase (glutamine-hydrolyzing) [Pseudomonadota bacterium]
MCGIAGILSPSGVTEECLNALCRAMTGTLHHRGPDDYGVWTDPAAGITLGHRRLSIQDLSPLGHQPMVSESGRYQIVFNGEIYNFLVIKAKLTTLGHSFRGGSDTEVLLAAFEEWGTEALIHMNGMFAFALWDREQRTLLLARDRLGKKPLYYGMAGPDFVFGSELKALREHPAFDPVIDRNALCLYFRHNYIPAPHSIYSQVRKLPPGHTLTVSDGIPNNPVCYWSPKEIFRNGLTHPFLGDEEEASQQLERLLLDATGLRMLADVPVGAFLSGGIDSSLVVAMMQARSNIPVKTFSIGFDEERFNEAHHASAVARHLGTDHTELILTPKDLLGSLASLPWHWDEPFSDSGQFTALSVCKLAREQVTVALSGDGGDELFLGYDRYGFTAGRWERLAGLPLGLRQALGRASRILPTAFWNSLGVLGPKLQWRLETLGAPDFTALYQMFISHRRQPECFVLGGREPATAYSQPLDLPGLDNYQTMSLRDILVYLPDDILCKVDRASMAVSLETRAPLLDYRVAEFAATLPTDFKNSRGVAKRVLRRVLYRHVPRALLERPKMGFGVPVEEWLRGPLRSWCEDMLDERLLYQQNYVDAAQVRSMWKQFLAGQNNLHQRLWDVLMFQAWLAQSHDNRPPGR